MKRALYFLVGVLCLNIPLSVFSQNCSVNADVDQTICFSQPMTLNGQVSGSLPAGYVTTWSQVGGPSVVITSPNALVTSVTGYTGGNQYTFRLSTTCLDGTPTFDLVRFTVLSHTIANAGPDMVSCPGSNVGNMAANAVGANENGAWTIVGANNAGVTLGSTTSPTSSISLAATSAGTTTLRWTISNTNGCSSYDDVVITN